MLQSLSVLRWLPRSKVRRLLELQIRFLPFPEQRTLLIESGLRLFKDCAEADILKKQTTIQPTDMTPGPPVDSPYSKRLRCKRCQDRTKTWCIRSTYVVIPVITLYESMSASSTVVESMLFLSHWLHKTSILHDA